MNNIQEKNLRELGASTGFQLTFGAIFTAFSIAIILFKEFAQEKSYSMFIIMIVIMIFSMPLIYFFGKRYIGVKIKEPDKEPPNIKVWALVILIIWILNKLELKDLLRDFTKGNEVASLFLILIPVMAFFLHKTNLIIEAFIFVLGVILFHILEAQITLTYLVIFYLFMGVVFLTGGIMDFRKFSKMSVSV
jgi:hypothetical protein